MKTIENLAQRGPEFCFATGLTLVGLLGVIDYVTGPQISFALFYLLPIGFVTWTADRRSGAITAVTCAIAWWLAEVLWPVPYSHPLIPFWNGLMRLVVFELTVLVLSEFKVLKEHMEGRDKSMMAKPVAEIDEHRKTEDLLRARNEELMVIAEMVEHNLKNPLKPIAGYAHELTEIHGSDPNNRGSLCATQILSATNHVNRLIEDLLRYTRLGNETAQLEHFLLLDTIEGILKEQQAAIDEFHTEVSVCVLILSVDAWKQGLTQVLQNVIHNAIKFSRKSLPPRVNITAVEFSESYRIVVSDNGIGFDVNNLDRAFGLFERLVAQDEFEGTGVGLAIAKHLVDKMHGKIWAEAKPGAGATFYIELPNPRALQNDSSLHHPPGESLTKS